MNPNRTLTNQDIMADALRVLVLTRKTREWLEANDPMALWQAQGALQRWDREQHIEDERRYEEAAR